MSDVPKCQRRGYHQATYGRLVCDDCGITRIEAAENDEEWREPMTLNEFSQ